MSKLLNTKDAAKELGVSVRRIQFLIKNEQLKAEKFGRDYMIRESDLPKLEKRKRGRPIGSKNKPPEVPEVPEVPKKREWGVGGYSVRDAAAMVGVPRSTMAKMIRDGLIRSEKVGGTIWVNFEDVSELEKKRLKKDY